MKLPKNVTFKMTQRSMRREYEVTHPTGPQDRYNMGTARGVHLVSGWQFHYLQTYEGLLHFLISYAEKTGDKVEGQETERDGGT